MPFGLSNASSIFMQVMNQVLRPLLNKFVVVYFDDILIYSRNKTDHQLHLREVFKTLRAKQLFANPKKCSWMVLNLVFLRFIISGQGISPDEKKMSAIRSWPCPTTISEVCSFLGHARFYKRFIKSYNTITASIIDLLKGKNFAWTEEAQKAFEQLKSLLTNALVLTLPNFDRVFEVECDASFIGIGAVLSKDKKLVTYFSEKLGGPRINNSIYDVELYACSISQTLTSLSPLERVLSIY
jgi:RNase H-like domain found in reverse transcriptase/Reverse transcriptase (RNA-dependent DNA polymerase)